jgi:hypothetical protein
MIKKWIIGIASLLLVAYAGSYAILSVMGDYQGSQSGNIRYETGLAVTDISIWKPKGIWYQSEFIAADGKKVSRGNSLGFFYAPLVVLDRKVFHRTSPYIEAETEK